MEAKKPAFALLLFLLFVPLLFAQTSTVSENPVKAVAIKNLGFFSDYENYTLNISAFSFSSQQAIDPANPDPITTGYSFNSASLKDAEIYFEAEYFGISAPIRIATIKTSKQSSIEVSAPTPTNPAAKAAKALYYGEASGQWPSELKDKCFLAKVRFENYPLDSEKVYKRSELDLGTVCAGKGGRESVLLVGIKDALFNSSNSALCFPAIILFGLLVAGLYSRGMTLFSIMDLITPKAPTMPAFKYTYASFSPFGQLGTEAARSIRQYEAYILPSALRMFNRAHGLNLDQHRQYGSMSVAKKMISSIAKEYTPNMSDRFIQIISDKKVSDADAHIMAKRLFKDILNKDDGAMLDLIGNYLAYKDMSEAIGGRKPLSRPLKLIANSLFPLASGPAWWRNIMVSVRHGVVDTLYGVNSSMRVMWGAHLKLFDILSAGKAKEPVKHMRVQLIKMRDSHEGRIKSKLSNLDIYKTGKYYEGGTGWFHGYQWQKTGEWLKDMPESLAHWAMARGIGTGILFTGEPEAPMGEFTGARINGTANAEYLNLLQGTSIEAMAQYLRSLVKQTGINEQDLSNPILSVKERTGKTPDGSENIERNISKINEIYRILEEKADGNFGFTEKMRKLNDLAFEISKEINNTKLSVVLNEVQKNEHLNAGIMSHTSNSITEKVIKFLDSESQVFANAGNSNYYEATKKMMESLRKNGNATDPHHETPIEKYTGAFHDLVQIMKEYRDEKATDFFFLKSTQKGFELMRETNQNKNIEPTKDSFFVGIWLSAVDKMEQGLFNEKNIAMKDLFAIYSLESLNERTGLISSPDIIKEVNPMMFAGTDRSNGEETKKGLMDSSVLGAAFIVSLLKEGTLKFEDGKAVGIQVVTNKLGETAEIVNFNRVNKILGDFGSLAKIANKEDFVGLVLHPENYGVSLDRVFEFRMRIAQKEVIPAESNALLGKNLVLPIEAAAHVTKMLDSGKTIKEKTILPAFDTALAYRTLDNERKLASEAKLWKNEMAWNKAKAGELGILNFGFSEKLDHRWKIITQKFTDENFPETSRRPKLTYNKTGNIIEKIASTRTREHDYIFDALTVIDMASSDKLKLPNNKEITKLVDLAEAKKITDGFIDSVLGAGSSSKFSINMNSKGDFVSFFISPTKELGEKYNLNIDPKNPEMRVAIAKLRDNLFEKCVNPGLRKKAHTVFEEGSQNYSYNFGSPDIIEKKINSLNKFYDSKFLQDIEVGITATSRFFTRKDYTPIMRQTAFWKYMEARYGGEFEKSQQYLSHYTYDADMGLLNALGRGMMIDSAERYHSLASIYQMTKAYCLKYTGVNIFDKEAVAENINKYTFKELLQRMKDARMKEGISEADAFKLTPTELQDSGWFLSKELGYIPFIHYATPDEALLPAHIQNKLRAEDEKAIRGLCTKEEASRVKEKIIENYAHESQISPYHMMISTSFYPVNLNFYLVKNGRLKKIVLESLSDSSSDLMGLVMRQGKELVPVFSEALSEIIFNSIKKGGQKWEFLKTSIEETGLATSRQKIGITEEKLKALAQEMFGESAKVSDFEAVKKLPIDEYRQFFREIVEKAKYNNEQQSKAEAIFLRLKDPSATVDSLTFSDISFLIKAYAERDTNATLFGKNLISEILYNSPKGVNANDPSSVNANVLKKFLECYGMPEMLSTITRTYGRFKDYEDKAPIKNVLKFLESKGEYQSAAGMAFELAENSGDQSFFLNVKGLYFGSNKEIRQRLHERGISELRKSMQNLTFIEKLSNLSIASSYMKLGMPLQFAIGETFSALVWSTFHKEINAEERIFHTSELAKATDFRMCYYNKEYLRKLDREMARDISGNPFTWYKYVKRMVGTDPIDIRIEYVHGALIESGAITREMGLNYGAIDSTKRDGRIGAMFHLRSTLGASEMYSTAYVLGMSTPIMRNFSPFGSMLGMGMLLATPLAFMGTGPFITGMVGAAFLSGTLPRVVGRTMYKTSVAREQALEEKLEKHISGEAKLSDSELKALQEKIAKYHPKNYDEKWTRRFAAASMRTDIGQLATRFASGFFNTTYGGPIRALATFQRHYIFPPPSDLIPQAPITSGGKYVYTPKKAWPTNLPRPGQAIKSAYTNSLLYGMPVTAFLGATLASPFGLGAMGGILASVSWFGISKFSQGVFAKRNNELRGHTGGFMDKSRMSITQRLARKISTLEGYEFGTPDEIQWRKAPGTFDFRWYTHEIADVGATTWGCPGQSYTDFYTGYYKTEPWIQHHAARNANMKGGFTSIPLSEAGRAYDMFSRYNATPVNKAMQSWKDIIGYEPSESAMWFVFSPYMLSLWLKRRMEEVTPVYNYYKNYSMIYGATKEESKKMRGQFLVQGIKMGMYGLSLPALTTVGPAAVILGSPMLLGGVKAASSWGGVKPIREYFRKRAIAKEEGEKNRFSGAYGPFLDSTFGQKCPSCGQLKSRGGKCRSCGWDPISQSM